MSTQISRTIYSWPIFIVVALLVLIIISSCSPGGSQVVEEVEQSNDRGIVTDEPVTGSPDAMLNDEESEGESQEGEPPEGDRSENEEIKNEQDEEVGSEIEAEEPSPDPTTIPRSDRLTPTIHPPEGVERVPDLTETPVVGEVPQDIMESVLEDVTEQSGADIEDAKVIRAENIVWPDGSMGCGKPGEMYTQAQVPGYWVVLEVNGETYDYRVTENGFFNKCEQSRPSNQPPITGGTPDM